MRLLVVIAAVILYVSTASAQRMPHEWYKARAALEVDSLSKAVDWLHSLVDNNPRSFTYLIQRGDTYLKKHEPDSALADFKKAESIRSGSASYGLASAYAMLGDTSQAIYYLKEYLGSTNKRSEAQILLCPAFNKLKGSREWKELWLTDWYSPRERLLADFHYLISLKQWQNLLNDLNEHLTDRRGHHQLLALRGQAYYMLGSYRAAEADFADALKRSRRNHEYMWWRARALLELDRNRRAMRVINKAIDLSGGDPNYHLVRAQIHASNHDWEQAATDAEYFLRFYPHSMDAIGQLAGYLYNAGRYIDALRMLNRVIKSKPNDPALHYMRAQIYMNAQRWEMALIDLEKATSISPSKADYHLNLGIVQRKLGNSAEACRSFRKAKERGNFQSQEYIYNYCR